MTEIEELIQERWQQEEAPIMDGILYDDGRLTTFSYESAVRGGERRVDVIASGSGHLSKLLEQDPDIWTSLVEMNSLAWEEGGLELHCGGGGFGSDGYVAATRVNDGRLVWLMFSQRSNPFRRLALQGDLLTASTELGQAWRLDVRRPENVHVV